MSELIVTTDYPGHVTVSHRTEVPKQSATRRTKLGGWDVPGWVIDTDVLARVYPTKAAVVAVMSDFVLIEAAIAKAENATELEESLA